MTQSSVAFRNFTVEAPARIHFGLFSVDGPRVFGGAGVMVKEPATVLNCQSHTELTVVGKHRELVEDLVKKWMANFGLSSDRMTTESSIGLKLNVRRAAPRHAGFGTGTQMALAVATAICHALDIPSPSDAHMAAAMKRGKRSAIGSYGFSRGGFLVDSGVSQDNAFAPLKTRLNFPDAWSIVLIQPRSQQGFHGNFESSAFEKLRDSTRSKRDALLEICMDSIVPALKDCKYEDFGKPLFDFNRISGEYFSDLQNGPYNGPVCSQIVDDVRRFGIEAVGQSSWGPCIFAVAPNKKAAEDLVTYLRSSCRAVGDESQTDIIITSADNSGAQITEHSERETTTSEIEIW